MNKEIIAVIDAEIRLLQHARKVLASLGSRITGISGIKPLRKISAAGKKRIAVAQRARWRKIKRAKKSA
jgi:hypothetical protein